MSKILKIIGREIIDSRGYPTVEAEVYLKGGFVGRSSVPSGSSKGSNEALELRDGDKSRFFGKGVKIAVNSIKNFIAPLLLGKNAEDQKFIDQLMIDLDGTKNKSNLGSNAILAVSLAIAKATSLYKGINLYEYIAELNGTPGNFSMPLPMINIINGGKHADNNIEIQEFMIQPVGAKTFKEAVRIGAEVFHSLGKVLKEKNLNTSVGDEGGYAPNLNSNYEALDIIIESINKANYRLYKDITLAIDCAASEFFNKSTLKYQLKSENKNLNSKEFIYYLENLTKKYPIVSIEDGLYELAWEEFIYLTKILGNKIQIVGDDLFVTNTIMLKKGIENNVANSILIKLNQIGTLSETLLTIKMAKNAGYSTIISHRSGETEDTTIADLAVGTAAGQIKIGSISRSERVAKYNQLIRIEEQLNNKFLFKGLKELKFYKNINI